MIETTKVRTPRVFAIQHPDMSEALIMKDLAGRTDERLITWAQMHMMREFNAFDLHDRTEWIVAPLKSDFDSAVSVDLFSDWR